MKMIMITLEDVLQQKWISEQVIEDEEINGYYLFNTVNISGMRMTFKRRKKEKKKE